MKKSETKAPYDPSCLMGWEEVIDMGILQEINRRLLHPLGLILCISPNDEIPYTATATIFDHRADPEGIVFDEVDRDKALNVTRMEDERPATLRAVQPINVTGKEWIRRRRNAEVPGAEQAKVDLFNSTEPNLD